MPHACPFAARGVGDPDPVDLLLDATQLEGVVWSETRPRAPWSFRARPGPDAPFHYLLEGRAWILASDGVPRRMEAGSLVILPHGDGHVLCDDPATPPIGIEDGCWCRNGQGRRVWEMGGDGVASRLLCGAWRHDGRTLHPLLAALPEVILLSEAQVNARSGLRATLHLLVQEFTVGDVGFGSVSSRLLDILFVQALRGWLDETEVRTGWLGALRDPVAGRALRALHAEPARDWTLTDLARKVDSSRSVVARRFQQTVGEPPMAYLSRVRMQEAAQALRDPSVSLAEVATQVGYSSEFAFNRAFKRWAGVPPGRFRSTGAAGAAGDPTRAPA